jgi:hypothetical protein
MNWFKENPLIAAIALTALLGTIGSGFLLMHEIDQHNSAVGELTIASDKLRTLQKMDPYPDADNLESIEVSVNDYSKAIADFTKHLNALEVPLNKEINPQEFQDGLREAVNKLQSEAHKNNVSLPEKFFFGFEAYQSQLPTQDEVKELHREFLAIEGLLSAIIPLGISSIDTLVRNQDSESIALIQNPKIEPTEPVKFKSFTLAFTASQNSLIKAFDKIPGSDDSPRFLVLRNLTIENTSPTAPKKTSPDRPGDPSPNSYNLKPAASEKLPLILGNESVKATMLFEVPDFPTIQASTPPKK